MYDISNLQSANGNPINFAIPAGSHGFVVISSSDGMGNQVQEIVGNFRIVRNNGYEYRVNSALSDDFAFPLLNYVARFTDNWGANQSDIVGVRVVPDPGVGQLPDGTWDLTVQITDPHELFVFDDEETGTSCGESIFGCDERPGDDDNPPDDDDLAAFTTDFINQGINEIFPNTRGGLELCSGDFNTDGFVRLRGDQGQGFTSEDLIGFVGLNDGATRGSMDRFKSINIDD